MLQYTLDQLFTQRAVVYRNTSTGDGYGAPAPDNFQYHETIRCRLWWQHSSGVRSANRTYVSPGRTVPVAEGGMIVPTGTDVTEQDLIYEVNDNAGNVLYESKFTVVAVVNNEDHIELSLIETTLGT